jgi:hypothetical protein
MHITGALQFLWAAENAATHRKNPEEFHACLELAAQTRQKTQGYEHEGLELAFLAKHSNQVYALIQNITTTTPLK